MSYDFRTTLRGPSNGTMEFDSSIFSSTVTLKAPLTVQSTAQFDQAVTMNGPLAVNSTGQFAQAVTVNGQLAANSTAQFAQAVTVNGSLAATSTAQFAQAVTVNGAIAANSTAQFAQAVTMNGTLSANAPVNINAALTTASTADFNGVAQFNNTLKCGVVNSTSDTITLAATRVRLNADVEIAGKLTFLANTARSITLPKLDESGACEVDFQSIGNDAGIEIFCQTKEDLKKASTSMPLYFDGDIWLPQSAHDHAMSVAADTVEGCFVQSTLDPTCVWARNVSVYVPEHFGAEQSTDQLFDSSFPIQVGIDTAHASRTAFHFPGNTYGVSCPLRVPAGTCITSSNNAMLVSMMGNDDAVVVLDADSESVPVNIALPSLRGFQGTAVSVLNADLVTLSANSITDCGTAVKFQNSRNGVAKVHRIRECDVAVHFASETSGSGLVAHCISGAATCVLCSGDADTGGQYMVANIIDIARGGGAVLDNTRSTPVTNFRAIVNSRCAGDGFNSLSPTQLVAGLFSNARLEFNDIAPLDEAHLAIGQLQRSSVRLQALELPRHFAVSNADLSDFNGGRHIGAVAFLLQCTFPTSMDAGSLQTFYAWNIFADSSMCLWTADVVGGDARGCIVTQIVDEASPANGGRLKIVILNVVPVEQKSTALIRIRRLM